MAIASEVVKRKRTKKSSPQYNIGTREGLADYARSVGLDKGADAIMAKPKLSLLQRIGRGFSAFEPGDSIYKTLYEKASFPIEYAKDIAKGLGSLATGKDYRLTPKKTWKDIMVKEGMKDRPGKLDVVDVTGLAADIVTDPTTWFGGFIGKGIKKTAGVGFKVAKELPVVGKPLKVAQEATEGLFKPFAELQKTTKGAEYVDNVNKYFKGMRSAQNDFMEEIAKRAKSVKKAIGKKEFNKLRKISGEAIETGTKTGNELFDDLLKYITENQKSYAKQLLDNGQISASMEDYMHHALVPEAAALLNSGADISGFMKPMLKASNIGKKRKIIGAAKEINEAFNKKFGVTHGLFDEDALNAFSKSGLKSIHDIHMFDFQKRIGAQFGEKLDKKLIGTIDPETGLKWAESGIKGLENKMFPEPILKDLQKTADVFASDDSMNQFLRLYDKAQNFWKGTVTGYFPAFHTRNGIGGVFNNFIAGLKNPATYKKADDILRGKAGSLVLKNGEELSYDTVRKLIKEYGVTGQTGIFDVAKHLQKEIDPGILTKINKAPQQIMGAFEDHLRVPLFIDTLKKSGAKNIEDAAVEASKKVLKYHFDYMPEAFTPFERDIMKRIIPFYTFTRHNIPLQIEQMIMQPGKYAGVMKLQRSFGNKPSSEEEAILPKWLKERFTIKGEGGYWSGLGLPMEEATEKISAPLRGFGISMSPFIKTPIEALTGYNIFKGRRIDTDTYGKYYGDAPKPLKDLLQLKEHTSKTGKKYYTVNPRRKYWLELIGARGLNTVLRLNNNIKQDKGAQALREVLTTIRNYDYSIEDLKKWSDKDAMNKLEGELLRAGQLSEYTNRYIPKNVTTTEK